MHPHLARKPKVEEILKRDEVNQREQGPCLYVNKIQSVSSMLWVKPDDWLIKINIFGILKT